MFSHSEKTLDVEDSDFIETNFRKVNRVNTKSFSFDIYFHSLLSQKKRVRICHGIL